MFKMLRYDKITMNMLSIKEYLNLTWIQSIGFNLYINCEHYLTIVRLLKIEILRSCFPLSIMVGNYGNTARNMVSQKRRKTFSSMKINCFLNKMDQKLFLNIFNAESKEFNLQPQLVCKYILVFIRLFLDSRVCNATWKNNKITQNLPFLNASKYVFHDRLKHFCSSPVNFIAKFTNLEISV